MEDYGASDGWWVSPWWSKWQCNVSIYPNFSSPYWCAHFRIAPITWQIMLSKSCVNNSSSELLIVWVGYSLKNSRKYLKWQLSLLQQQYVKQHLSVLVWFLIQITCALDEWTDGQRKNVTFSADKYHTVYMSILKLVETLNKNKYHKAKFAWAHWSSLGSPKWLRTGYEPKASLQGAGKEWTCGYVQDPISIYRMRWLLVPALPQHELWARQGRFVGFLS